jgi:hypothetical protein
MMSSTINKITISLILATGVLCSYVTPADELNDLEKFRLKGKVRSVMETKYAVLDKSDKSAVNTIIYQKLLLFDPYGYLQEITIFNDGAEYLISKFMSGSDGKPFEMNEFHPDGTLNLKVIYTYDEKEMISEAVYNWSENRVVGEICEMVDYYDDILKNELFTKVQYEYEYRGYCTGEIFFKPDGNLSFKLTAKFDFRGNQLESSYFHANSMLAWMTKYQYDRYDNLIESRVFKSNRIVVQSEYKYTFDDTGNWLTRKEKRAVEVNILTAGLNQSDMITERSIEYY